MSCFRSAHCGSKVYPLAFSFKYIAARRVRQLRVLAARKRCVWVRPSSGHHSSCSSSAGSGSVLSRMYDRWNWGWSTSAIRLGSAA